MSITSIDFEYDVFNFPCGEKHVKIKNPGFPAIVEIEFNFEKNEDIIELLLVCNALKAIGYSVWRLKIPYVPFSRQDRINVPGECFSLKVFCDLINSIGAQEVTITDPHSDVTPALINNCRVIHQYEVFRDCFIDKSAFYLVCPDAGALKKIYKLAEKVNPLEVIEFRKIRDVSTGEISGIETRYKALSGRDCYIVDDICDGGKTFVGVARELKEMCAGKIILMVTHGFFTRGLSVFDGLIDEIYTRKGRVK